MNLNRRHLMFAATAPLAGPQAPVKRWLEQFKATVQTARIVLE